MSASTFAASTTTDVLTGSISNSSSSLKVTTTNLIECGPNRVRARSVSWNSTGNYLAMASQDRMTRIWTVEGGTTSREIMVVGGHTAPVIKTRFHPTDPNSLLTTAGDYTIRLWDVRAAATANQAALVQLEANVVSVEWCYPKQLACAGMFVVTDRNANVLVYDVRQLSSAVVSVVPATTTTTNNTATSPPLVVRGRTSNATTPALHSYHLAPHVPESCVVSPDGGYLVAGTCHPDEGVGEFRIWPWQPENSQTNTTTNYTTRTRTYAAHCGPIYALQFSPDGTRLASGGSDATVQLWHVDSMCCLHSMSRLTKFISHVAFSPDSQMLAVASDDDGIGLMEAATGAWMGVVNLSLRPIRSGGAEEVAWHPKAKEYHLLACARSSSSPGNLPVAPVTVAKLAVSSAGQ